MQIHNTNKETQVNTSPTSSCFPVWLLPLLLCTDMYWCKTACHQWFSWALVPCHADASRVGWQTAGLLGPQVFAKRWRTKIKANPSSTSKGSTCCLKRNSIKTLSLEKSIFYFRMRKFIKGSFSWNYISPCNNGVCFLSNLFTTVTCTQLGKFWWKALTILTNFKTWTISERSSWWWGDSSLHHSHLLSANVLNRPAKDV